MIKPTISRLIKRFIQWRSDVIAIFFLPIAWYVMQQIIWQVDSSAGVLDTSYFTVPFISWFYVLAAHLSAMLGLRYAFKPWHDYYRNKTVNGDTQMHRDISDLYHPEKSHRWKRILLYLAFYLSFFLSAVSLTIAMLGK